MLNHRRMIARLAPALAAGLALSAATAGASSDHDFPTYFNAASSPSIDVAPTVIDTVVEPAEPIVVADGGVQWQVTPEVTRVELLVGLVAGRVLDVRSVAPGEAIGFRVLGGERFEELQRTPRAVADPEGDVLMLDDDDGADDPTLELLPASRYHDAREYKNINVTRATHLLLREAVERQLEIRVLTGARITDGHGASWSWHQRTSAAGDPAQRARLEALVRAHLEQRGIPAAALDALGTPTVVDVDDRPIGVGLLGAPLSIGEHRCATEHTMLEVAIDGTNSLDWYSNALQYEKIRRQDLENRMREQEIRLREIGLEIAASGTAADARRYEIVMEQLRRPPADIQVPRLSDEGE